MNSTINIGYITPVESDQEQEYVLETPPTPRHQKRTIGVKRLPSDLAMPDLDLSDSNDHNDGIPTFHLKPRSRAAPFTLLSRSEIEVRVDSVSSSNKRPRRHLCAMRASLAHRENVRASRTLPSRSDSCDW